MPKFKELIIIYLCFLLFACGGGGDDTSDLITTQPEQGQQQPTPEPEEQPDTEEQPDQDSSETEPPTSTAPDLSGPNGIYVYQNSPKGMIVDLEQENFPVIGMDWVNHVFFIVDHADFDGKTITGTGFTGFRRDSSTEIISGEESDDKVTTFTLGDMQATTKLNIDNSEYNYNYTSKTYSPTLENLVGSHVASDGSEIIIKEDGAVTINAAGAGHYCTFEADLVRRDVYFRTDNLKASGCANEKFNGEYLQGAGFTMQDSNGVGYISLLMIKDEANLAWLGSSIGGE